MMGGTASQDGNLAEQSKVSKEKSPIKRKEKKFTKIIGVKFTKNPLIIVKMFKASYIL